jgi:glycosyltransferase involved in cell wall biosynthesis
MKIGIITPSFNQGCYLAASIESVVRQSYAASYYAIYDACSSDASNKVLAHYSRHPRVSRLVIEKDRGQADAINRGFSEMPTDVEIMAWLNSDDMLAPGALELVSALFKIHPEIDFITGARRLIGVRGRPTIRVTQRPRTAENFYLNTGINQEATFWRRSLYRAAGDRVDVNFRFAMDYELWFRMREVPWRPLYVPIVLGYFRIHKQAKTSTQIDTISVREQNQLRSARGLPELTRDEFFKRVGQLEAREFGLVGFWWWRLRCQVFKRLLLPLYA